MKARGQRGSTAWRHRALRWIAPVGGALAIGVAFLAVVGLSRWAAAQSAEPVRVGIMLPKSGTYAVQGSNGHNGAMLAVDDFGGKVLGRPIQVFWEDEVSPQASVQGIRKMIHEDKVVAVDGGINSGDVLAMMPIALRNKILFMASGPNATEITGKSCNRYTFRVDLPNHVTVRAVFPSLWEGGKNKRWYFLSASYAWGIDAYQQMKDLLQKREPGAVIVGQDQAPLGTTDFSSYILKLRAENPDVVFLGLGGTDLTNFLKQLYNVGLTSKVVVSSPIVNDSDLWAAGPQAATGTYPKLWNYTGPYNTPKSQEFVKKYEAKYGQPPEVEAWQDWFGMTAILTAIQKTGSTDSKKLIQFLEEQKFSGYKDMPISFRSWDHQLLQPVLVAEVKKPITSQYDYFNIIAQDPKGGEKALDAFYGTRQVSECHMGPLD
jgi:branched-chain amino acid transport system substrate-binding protein